MKLRWKQLMVMAVVVFGMTACSSANETNSQPIKEETKVDTIRMASWSKPIVEQSNLYVAEEKGMFEEAGLQFEYVPGAGGGDAVKNIIAGNADIAFANMEAVLLAAEQGEKLKIIYNIYPENVFNLVSLKESGIESIEDLKGKEVGVYSLTSGTYQNLQVLLHKAGMTEADIKVIPTGVLNFGPLMQNQVVATAATDTGLFDAKQKGLGEVNVIEVKDVLNTPSDVFVVTEQIYNEKKESIEKFLQVYKESTEYVMEHPEEAAKIAQSAAIDGQDEARNLEIIQIRNVTAANEEGLGMLDINLLKQVEQTYLEMGLLQKSVDIEALVTNEFVQNLD
ncbi:ABC transporter substrate-binding protein [Cytobacillus spongiae]|jgi:NitT/TauT family transport system substrate-binding protein|uniref:ABC transporter substrate-binding protein n=1 Tax=Cytobacillus spongiae TaxID=2901381 RepID=UPI001F1F235B|nr:ABC transporter substrate-binding protein [Cytobacillus spongiae]UII56423.1 ABC transporter substrate-binding protein [Cytobacillus spongiae]